MIFIIAIFVPSLVACRSEDEPIEEETFEYVYLPEPPPRTPEQERADFENFFTHNRERIIHQTPTDDGEEIRLELGAGNEFIMTILFDDVELDDENRALYALAFGLTFSGMDDIFEEIATEIMNDAWIPNFRLTVIFADAHGEEIARSRFDVIATNE